MRHIAGPKTFLGACAVDGEQYILVASGWGSYAAILMPALLPQLEKVPAASTLIAFKVSK